MSLAGETYGEAIKGRNTKNEKRKREIGINCRIFGGWFIRNEFGRKRTSKAGSTTRQGGGGGGGGGVKEYGE